MSSQPILHLFSRAVARTAPRNLNLHLPLHRPSPRLVRTTDIARPYARSLTTRHGGRSGAVAARARRLPLAAEPAFDPEKPLNPETDRIDPRLLHHRLQEEKAYYVRRMKVAGAGLLVCIGLTLAIVLNVEIPEKPRVKTSSGTSSSSFLGTPEQADASNESNHTFQGKPVVIAHGGSTVVAHDPSGRVSDIELVPTGTSSVPHFPKTIAIPTPTGDGEESYTLLGLGIRTVSFLSIQVYVVGLYVATATLPALQAQLIHQINPTASTLIADEKDALRQKLLDPETSTELWDTILSSSADPTSSTPISFALRVVPVRDTNFQHLRDGWVRGITQRTQEAAQRSKLQPPPPSQQDPSAASSSSPSPVVPYQDDPFRAAMDAFRALFGGKGKAPKASVLLLTRDAPGGGALRVLYQAHPPAGRLDLLGAVPDERVSRLIWELYLAGKNVSSPGARQSVVDGCVALCERPVGTVGTDPSAAVAGVL